MGFQELCLLCYETLGVRHSEAARVTDAEERGCVDLLLLADLHYFVLQTGQVFTRAMVAVNTWISHYRQRVEHVMASIKAHEMFKRRFCGSKAMLTACITLTMHMTSAKIRHAWDEEAYHKYQGFNTPWEWPLHIP